MELKNDEVEGGGEVKVLLALEEPGELLRPGRSGMHAPDGGLLSSGDFVSGSECPLLRKAMFAMIGGFPIL